MPHPRVPRAAARARDVPRLRDYRGLTERRRQRRLTAPSQVAHAVEILRRAALVLPRLGDCGQSAEGGVAEERREAVADEPLADELVPVAVGAERRLRVVHVKDAQAVEPDRHRRVRRGPRRAPSGRTRRPPTPTSGRSRGRPRAGVAIDRVRERRELGDRAADRPTSTCSVLHAEPEVVGRELEELAQRGLDERDGFVEPEAEVRADVEDNGLGADRVRGLHRCAERGERVLAHRRVAAREVDEVEGVARDGLHARLPAACAEARDLLRRSARSAATSVGSA